MSLGRHDPFRDVTSWDAATAGEWVAALERRAAGDDQQRMRREIVADAALKPADVVVEVGCGTGHLLVDLARAVSPGGRAVGVEPQPVLADAARAKVTAAGLAGVAEVWSQGGSSLPLADGAAAACVAQTVLVHLPAGELDQVLAEMCRVVATGGRVVSIDQDGDTWVLDHPDRDLTRRVVAFNSDQRYADGWTGRRLPRLFGAAGLRHVAVRVLPHVDAEKGSYLYGMALRIGGAAADAGALSPDERDRWVSQLDELAATGHFFSSINYYLCVGTRA